MHGRIVGNYVFVQVAFKGFACKVGGYVVVLDLATI